MADGIERAAEQLDKEAVAARKKSRKKKLRVVPGGGSFNADGRRVIRHDGGKVPEVLDQLGQALAEFGGDLFVHAGRLVRIYPAPELPTRGIHRPRGALILHPVEGAHLVEIATRAAIHERYDARIEGYRRCDSPRRVADAYLARGHWPELRTLSGCIEAPTVTLEGRLIDQPGFDDESGLFLAAASIPGYEAPPAAPNRCDAEHALELLLDVFREFPFVNAEDRAAAVAGIVTSVMRRPIPTCPAFGFSSPMAGTGKSIAADTFAIIATGRRASVLSLGHDEAESEKRLAGVLLAGDPVIVLDNISRPLKSDLLCQIASQESVRIRPLGGSGMVSVPTCSFIILTGNNLSIVGDLKRRVVLVRLDAHVERPEQRNFQRQHLAHVFSRRGELISAALTIVLAYQAAGFPSVSGLHALGGFEQWDAMVRRPLVWLGLPDPLRAAEVLREQDPDLEAMRLLFAAWRDVFDDKCVTAALVVSRGMEIRYGADECTYPELRDALQLVCSEKPNTRRLGYWLRGHADRICDGWQLQQSGRDEHAKVAKWKISSGAGDAGKAGNVLSNV